MDFCHDSGRSRNPEVGVLSNIRDFLVGKFFSSVLVFNDFRKNGRYLTEKAIEKTVYETQYSFRAE